MTGRTGISHSMLLRRKFIQGFSLALGAILLRTRSANAATPETVNLAIFDNVSAGILIRADKLIKASGLTKLNWIEVNSGAEVNTGMAAGSIDLGIGIGSVGTSAGIALGIPVEVFGVMDYVKDLEEMVVRKSGGIKAPTDLKGKRVGVPFGSSSQYKLLGFMKLHDLSDRDVNVLDLRGDALVAAWLRGDLDAAYIWSPEKDKLIANGGELFNTYESLNAAGYSTSDLYTARSSFLANYPDFATAVLLAHSGALNMYQSEQADAVSVLARSVGISPEAAKANWDQYGQVPLEASLSAEWLGKPGNPGALAEKLKHVADFLVSHQSIRAAPDLSKFQKAMNTGPLQKALG